MPTDKPDPLQPRLAETTQKLEQALDEACDNDIDVEDISELIRLEESLARASAAAKEAITVRQRLQNPPSRSDESKPADSHRVFTDARGLAWDVFAVFPSVSGRTTLPESYRHGWLSFDSGTETRRLAPIPDDWQDAADEKLRELCLRAEVAARRKGSTKGWSAPR